MVKGKPFLACLAAVLALVAFQGCEDDEEVRYDTNRAPETYLSVAPEVGGRIFHKYHVHWAGLDRDGVVVSYRVASLPEDAIYGGRPAATEEDIAQYFIDQEQAYLAEGRQFWVNTTSSESLFVFSADKPNTRKHSLYVAAVDNEGKEDPMPAATNFLAIDYGVPDVDVCITTNLDPDTCKVPSASGDTLPAYNLLNPDEPVLIGFTWGGEDSDGLIREWRYRLDSSIETVVGPDVLSKQYTYDPNNPAQSDLGIGFHEFRLIGVDDAGASSDETITRFVINYDPDTHIDSIWTFRPLASSSSLPVPEKLIYPSDSIRVAYHLGRLRLKFHGTDIDGAPPDSFRWNIRGTLIQSANPVNSKWPWVGNACGEYYCDEFPSNAPRLDTDSPLTFYLRAKDRLGKVDGSPDTIVFLVNYNPHITSVSHEVLSPGSVKFTWECFDLDQDVPGREGDPEPAIVMYRYKVDDAAWASVTTKSNKVYVKNCTVTGLASGPHKFTLHAYNGVYLNTRFDVRDYDFELP